MEQNNGLKEELSETRKQIITLTNFVLASTLQKTDSKIPQDTINNLKKILD